MGIYTRKDSPFYWMCLEHAPAWKGRRHSTGIRIDAPTPHAHTRQREQAEAIYRRALEDDCPVTVTIRVTRSRWQRAQALTGFTDPQLLLLAALENLIVTTEQQQAADLEDQPAASEAISASIREGPRRTMIEQALKTCPVCDRTFLSGTARQRYCRRECMKYVQRYRTLAEARRRYQYKHPESKD